MTSSYSLSDVCESIGAILTDVCITNKSWVILADVSNNISCFDSDSPAGISVADFMRQVEWAVGGDLWPQCLILIDQLSRVTGHPVTDVNVHRLLLTACSIALKQNADGTGVSLALAEAGGIDVADLVMMERVFLGLLDWRVAVGPAAHQVLCVNHLRVRATARMAAQGPHDRPITLIPDAILPLRERFNLKAPLSDTAKQQSRESTGSGSVAAPGGRVCLTPCPPSTACISHGVRPLGRSKTGPPREQHGLGHTRPFAGMRIAAAAAFAQSEEPSEPQ
eukprot:TRINITY_DN19401_c3_g1_i1.p1 TRINITY_DN19401_c3_g1~~TRINITY_DN19401_c3_g1_i1.p1  ORF type:complete len:308 (+),score=57.90 TRINITY_DN19401_c3_g1_i1:89-925(+)